MMKDNNRQKKKVLKIYYKEQLQTIHYYPGTTQAELESTLRSLFNIQKDTNLIFLDEDGIPIALSSSLPSNLKLSLQVKALVSEEQKITGNVENKPLQETYSTSLQKELFKNFVSEYCRRYLPLFLRLATNAEVQNQLQQAYNTIFAKSEQLKFCFSESYKKQQITLSEDGKRVQFIDWGPSIRIKLKIEKNKKYYFQYTFETLTCCMSAYLFSGNDTQGEQSNISLKFGSVQSMNKLYNVVVGIAIDTVKNKWHIVNPTSKLSVNSYEINPDWQNPQMALWTKHKEAVCVISDLMEYPSYL